MCVYARGASESVSHKEKVKAGKAYRRHAWAYLGYVKRLKIALGLPAQQPGLAEPTGAAHRCRLFLLGLARGVQSLGGEHGLEVVEHGAKPTPSATARHVRLVAREAPPLVLRCHGESAIEAVDDV